MQHETRDQAFDPACGSSEMVFMKPTKILLILAILVSAHPGWGKLQSFHFYLYKNEDPAPAIRFSPTDRIVACLILKDLPSGRYTFHADWYNAAGKLQESSRHQFEQRSKRDEKKIESRLEFIKASLLRRIFSASESTGYHMKFYGNWEVRLFLNGEEIGRSVFEIK